MLMVDGGDPRFLTSKSVFRVIFSRVVVLPLCMMAALTWLLQLLLVGNAVRPVASASSASDPSSHSSLADLALAKVLADGSQIFGTWGDNSTASYSSSSINSTTLSRGATWMSRLPDNTPLIHMNIPGTHESATWNFSQATRDSLPQNTNPSNGVADAVFYRCQSASMHAALEAGVRFFDLRYALDPTFARLVFWHSAALMSARATVADVLFGFYAWLERRPSETVILSFQYEGGTQAGARNDAAVQGMLFELLTDAAARRYFLQRKDELGTLGEARGKIVLFRRFDLDQLPVGYEATLPGLHFSPAKWADDGKDIALVYNDVKNLTVYVEDYYEPDDVVGQGAAANIAAKVNATTAHLAKAASGEAELAGSLFITFASAEHNDNDPPVTPEIMAIGNGSATTPAGGVNQQIVPYLEALKGKRAGIVVLDFWDTPTDLVELIYSL